MILVWLILILGGAMVFAALPLLIGQIVGLVVSVVMRRS